MAFTEAEENALRGMLAVFRTKSAALPDDVAVMCADVYPEWSGDGLHYATGERLHYGGTLYQVLQDHTSQADWTPNAAPSLFAKVLEAGTADTPTEEVPEWEQPDSTNPYPLGARVKHNGKVWESLVANNVWEPGATGTETVWAEVKE